MTSADTLFPAPIRGADAEHETATDWNDSSSAGQARRGPFRPDLWLNSRQRGAARLRVFYFRGIDVVGVWAVSLIALALLSRCLLYTSPSPRD